MENSMTVPQKNKNIITIYSIYFMAVDIHNKHEGRDSDICTPVFIAALFVIAKSESNSTIHQYEW